MLFRLQAVSLFQMPHPVILPGAGVVRIGGQRLLVPDFGVDIIAELAAGEADQVGDIGMIVMTECLQRLNAAGISGGTMRVVRTAIATSKPTIAQRAITRRDCGRIWRSPR